MNSKIWLCLLALVMLLGNSVLAQKDKRPGRKAVHGELRKELATYQRLHIAPFILEQRKELDKKLSKADKRELADIRQQLALHRQSQKERFKQLKAERETQQTPLTEDQKAEFKAARAEQREQLLRLAELAKRNEKHLTPIGVKVKAQQEKWRTDLQAIAAKHGVTEEQMQNRERRRGPIKERFIERWNATRFLLIDPNKPVHQAQTINPEKSDNTSSLQLSPNPTTDKATLRFNVPTAGNVKIELLDAQGQVVQQAIDRTFPAGKQAQTVQLAALKEGVYFYRVTTSSGTETIRFLKQ
ncbi:T9SS type A sorting domain-containing protein [Rufibacter roseus]|uniref:T9SS type A sorting domain-containing protein n=1 Tax=Rufibacter roseus TaxID=1567108 RepID=A0ABW2DKT8_9BACT|nr:T9SS type A sorting domain-containing protein [Rufibacter roseus]